MRNLYLRARCKEHDVMLESTPEAEVDGEHYDAVLVLSLNREQGYVISSADFYCRKGKFPYYECGDTWSVELVSVNPW